MHAVHADRLKPCVQGDSVELYHFEAGYALEGVTPREWEVKNILGHRCMAGKPQFLIQWDGPAPGEETWDPVCSFVHRYSYKLPEYCRRQGIRLDLAEHLSGRPLELLEYCNRGGSGKLTSPCVPVVQVAGSLSLSGI